MNISPQSANRALNFSAVFFYVTAVAGQWVFVLYMILHYLRSYLASAPEEWLETAVVGYVEGDVSGNLSFITHIFAATILTTSGALQLVPYLRNKYRSMHRWNGRIFALTALFIAIGGLHLIWVRDAVSSTSTGISVSADAVLILVFTVAAVLRARKRKIADHRKWALRAFMAINVVWFFRVGTTFWVLMNGGEQVGIGENFDGPFVFYWHWGSLILPLVLLELYFMAPKRSPGFKAATAGAISVTTLAMGIGSVVAFFYLWLPFY